MKTHSPGGADERLTRRPTVPGLFVTGTGTGVGKTVAAGGIAGALRRRGVNVGVIKPIETGGPDPGGSLEGADAGFLSRLAEVDDAPALISPIQLREPAAPLVAAEHEGATIRLETIHQAIGALAARRSFLIVEGAGGLAVPITRDYLMLDLARDLGFPVLIVGHAGLGTINHTVLSDFYARAHGLAIAGILLNNPEPPAGTLAEKTNAAVIARMIPGPLLGCLPFLEDLGSVDGRRQLIDLCMSSINWTELDRAIGLTLPAARPDLGEVPTST
jgi:dethiobiotin synthetase